MPKPLATDIDRHIGSRLKKLRQREDVSAAALAEAIDSTQQQISRYEHGQNKLGAAQLFRIAQHKTGDTQRFYDIAEAPYKYQAVDYIREGYRRSVCGVDSIYYRMDGEIVEIIRILGRQDATESF